MIELEGKRRVLYQWELNQRVIVGCPPDTVVEFSPQNGCKQNTLPVLSYEEEGFVYANIPNVLLQIPGYLRVFIRPSAEDMRIHPEVRDFRVVRKSKPEDYDANYSETEVFSYKTLKCRVDDLQKDAGDLQGRVDDLEDSHKALEERVDDLEDGAGTNCVATVNGVGPDENGNVEVSALPDDAEQITMLIDADLLPAVHDASGAILTDEKGNIILRY